MRTIIALITICLFAGCSNYSNGSRTGLVTKFSKKGYVIKTWEGELLMGNMKSSSIDLGDGVKQTSVSNSFEFSVTEPSVIDSLNKAMESQLPVRLFYHEERFTFTFYRGNTNYFIDSVHLIR